MVLTSPASLQLFGSVRAHANSGSPCGFSNRVFGQGKRTRTSSAHFIRIATARVAEHIGDFWSRSVFGAGAFAHTLLMLLATQKLRPSFGATRAASAAVALYLLHNIFYASFAFIGGWIADRVKKNVVLAVGYSMAAMMAIAVMTLPVSIWTFALIFILGGTNVALEETAEDSFCAELVEEKHHGIAFGLLATVNGVGDFLSSVIVGVLWTAFGTTIAFGYSAILSIAGAALVLRVSNRIQACQEW